MKTFVLIRGDEVDVKFKAKNREAALQYLADHCEEWTMLNNGEMDADMAGEVIADEDLRLVEI